MVREYSDIISTLNPTAADVMEAWDYTSFRDLSQYAAHCLAHPEALPLAWRQACAPLVLTWVGGEQVRGVNPPLY